MNRFNTVNGKGCCNNIARAATKLIRQGFNTVNGKGCCNGDNTYAIGKEAVAFQYRKR